MKKILLLLLFMVSLFPQYSSPVTDGWNNLPKILKNIKSPKFPDQNFIITSFGAVADGQTDCTIAFKKAIDRCSKKGGGKVIVPAGTFLTGAIHLKSGVNLYISKDAVVKFSTDPAKYLPVVLTRFEGIECMNYSPLIYACQQKNIAITGEGILDGQGSKDTWWKWKESGKPAREKLVNMGEKGLPVSERVFGDGSYLRPVFFQPYKCKNILVEGVTFRNSSMWFLNPVISKNITFSKLTIDGLGPNNDGCDPECCKDVLIKDCSFNDGDDCIAIKSGRNNDGRRVHTPCENVIIQNCIMKDGHGGVVIGSEISGGVRNVFVEDCKMSSPNLDRALRFKTNSLRGGVVENIYARNIKVGEVRDAVIKIDYFYEEGDAGKFTPVMKNINVSNLTCEKSPYALWVKAYKYSPVKGLTLKDCNFNNIKNENVLENIEGLSFKNVLINNNPVNK